jgi:hypothetical protein
LAKKGAFRNLKRRSGSCHENCFKNEGREEDSRKSIEGMDIV